MHFWLTPDFILKKDRCVIHSHTCAALNILTSQPIKGELSLIGLACVHKRKNTLNFSNVTKNRVDGSCFLFLQLGKALGAYDQHSVCGFGQGVNDHTTQSCKLLLVVLPNLDANDDFTSLMRQSQFCGLVRVKLCKKFPSNHCVSVYD